MSHVVEPVTVYEAEIVVTHMQQDAKIPDSLSMFMTSRNSFIDRMGVFHQQILFNIPNCNIFCKQLLQEDKVKSAIFDELMHKELSRD